MCIEMKDLRPIGIVNVGNSCFLNSLVQCLCVPAMAESLQDRLDKSKDPLDMLVHSVATRSLRKQQKRTKRLVILVGIIQTNLLMHTIQVLLPTPSGMDPVEKRHFK